MSSATSLMGGATGVPMTAIAVRFTVADFAVTLREPKALDGETVMNVWKQPLVRLLAVNLAIGVMAAVLMIGGLLVINPGRLRDVILHDHSPLLPLGVLLFGFLITFGSAAMGAAIMMLGRDDRRRPPERSQPGEPRAVRIYR